MLFLNLLHAMSDPVNRTIRLSQRRELKRKREPKQLSLSPLRLIIVTYREVRQIPQRPSLTIMVILFSGLYESRLS